MDDKELRNLFEDYQPEIKDDFKFMMRLRRNIDAAEIVRKQNERVIKRNRIALVLSTLLGFISGILFTIIQPSLQFFLDSIFSSYRTMDSYFGYSNLMAIGSWSIISIFILMIALGSYNLVCLTFRTDAVKIHSRT